MNCIKFGDMWLCTFETLHGELQSVAKTEKKAREEVLLLKESYLRTIDKLIEKQEE